MPCRTGPWILFALLCLPRVADAQNAEAIRADPLGVVDSVFVQSDSSGVATIAVPDNALPVTLLVSRDRAFRSIIAYEQREGERTVTVRGVRDSTVLYIRYRIAPVRPLVVYRASPVIPPDDPDSTATFVPIERDAPRATSDPFGDSGLNPSGSITRGVIAGNRRDATIESGLRMELAGEIADGVRVNAVLSDENTPIVPEGTTQRIDEFDKVYIEVESSRARAQLGDFELGLGRSSFAAITRKLQGAQVEASWQPSSPFVTGGTATVAGASARGVYRSQSLQILEGVQGPYRIEGNAGERFIILIPGSEIVYLDGVQLRRGLTEDYVVDYATAEITFTPRRVMSADRRVTVEFQYTTNQFTRTLLASEMTTGLWQKPDGSPRATVAVTLLREADGSQFLDEFGLSGADSLLLAESGDDRASRSGAIEVEYDPEAPYVHYIREPTTISGGDTVFVALASAPSTGTPVYRVQFSRVQGQTGSYERVGHTINGIAYDYVGAGAGDYEPIRLLPQPGRQQLFDARAVIAPIAGLTVNAEWARSDLDLNRLSDLDAADDVGDALRIGVTLESPRFRLPVLADTRVSAGFARSDRDAAFATFDRVRSVEFAREWNLPFDVSSTRSASTGGETMDRLFGRVSSTFVEAGVELGRLDLGSELSSDRATVNFSSTDSTNVVASFQGEWVRTFPGLSEPEDSWRRQFGRAGYRLAGRRLQPVVEVEYEERRDVEAAGDSLGRRSIRSAEIRPGVYWSGQDFSAGVSAEVREEDRPAEGRLVDALSARAVLGEFRYRAGGHLRIAGNVGVRETRANTGTLFPPDLQPAGDRTSLVLGVNGDLRPLQRAVSVSWLYEAQTERTPRLQEIFVRIGPELGEFIWVDDNDDNVIQIEEFVRETTPNEGTYARTYIPSDSLFSIVGVHARARLDVRPARLISERDTRVKSTLAALSASTTVEVTEKNRAEDIVPIYTLQQGRFRQPGSTLNGRLLLRQELSWSLPSSPWSARLSAHRVQSLSDLAAGLEERTLGSTGLDLGYRITNRVRVSAGARREQNRVESAAFQSRTFDLRSTIVNGQASIGLGEQTTATLGGDVAWKDDALSDRAATIVKLPVSLRYRRPRGFQIFARLEVADIRMVGEASGLAEFELTDGRGAGRSTLWSVTGEYAFNQYLRGSVAYDGRAPANAPVIHTMRMQLSAVF